MFDKPDFSRDPGCKPDQLEDVRNLPGILLRSNTVREHEGSAYDVLGKRALARAIDVLLLAGPLYVISVATSASGSVPGFFLPVLLLLHGVYDGICMVSFRGLTPGKQLTGLRVERVDGSPLTGRDVLLRELVFVAGTLCWFIGHFWAVLDAKNRTWHDILAGTRVRYDQSRRRQSEFPVDNFTEEIDLAPFELRAAAWLIDFAILGALFVLINGNEEGRADNNTIEFLLPVLYGWLFVAHNKGQTPGKRLMNIRVAGQDGRPVTNIDALVRVLVSGISAGVMFIGYLYALHDGMNRTWHDRVARTLVVRTKPRRTGSHR